MKVYSLRCALLIPALLVACLGDDDPDTLDPVLADYGDAPDGRIQADGSFDEDGYPTLLGSDGARVLDTTAVALADGPENQQISLELDADDPVDPDGQPNISRFQQPQPDAENRDDHDNGIISAELDLTDPFDPMLEVVVGAALKDQARAGVYYINVLFDHNIDGAWNGTQGFAGESPPQQTGTDYNDEWVLKNVEVDLSAASPTRQISFAIPMTGAIYAATRNVSSGPYMRIALTNTPINDAVWKGQGEFAAGEIEDWLVAGLDDPPRLECERDPNRLFDFDGANLLQGLPCGVVRPEFASEATSMTFWYRTRQVPAPAGGPDVDVTCSGSPVLVAPNMGTAAAPFGLGCDADRLKDINGEVKKIAIDIQTDLNGAVFVKRGLDSAVAVELSINTEYLDFTDSATPDETITACIGVTGSHNTPYGGQILQLTTDKLDCAMLPNDGSSPGTFIVSGGEGFRGRGEMFLSLVGGGSAFITSGDVTSLTYNGVPADAVMGWTVPVDQSSSGILAVSFTSGLSFEIQIEITYNSEGFNTVKQTVISGTCTPQ